MKLAPFKCPHCNANGVSLVQKLVASAATWWGWDFNCSLCGQPLRVSQIAIEVQWAIFIICLATFPWFLNSEERFVCGYIAGGVMLVVGFLAPLKNKMLSG